jgi:hypothetical protein
LETDARSEYEIKSDNRKDGSGDGSNLEQAKIQKVGGAMQS